MKKIFVAIAFLLFALLVGITGTIYFGNIKQKTLSSLDLAESAIKEENLSKAAEIVYEAKEEWHKSEKILSLYIRHHHLDETTTIFAELAAAAESEETASMREKIASIKQSLDFLWENEKPSFNNIF